MWGLWNSIEIYSLRRNRDLQMKKLCFVTAARSEYGLLKWLMKDIEATAEFELQLIVTGGHLSHEQGHTVDRIIEDGFRIDYIVDAGLDNSSVAQIAESMGRMAEGFAGAFDQLKPDYLLVLGDRYELLPICNTAFVMRIPIIHLSGGDVTEGAIDDGIRNAVTMLSEYHFPGTKASAENIIRMRGSDKNIWTVGEPGLDAFNRERLWSREQLAEDLNINIDKSWALMTYHSETKEGIEYNINNVKSCIDVLLEYPNLQTVITYANADLGGREINEYIERAAGENSDRLRVIPSLGHLRYLSFMKQADFVIGNSSSGIVEAPFMNIPVVNIGNRQRGRYQCGNIIQCDPNNKAIKAAVKGAFQIKKEAHNDLDYWGDGHTSERIVNILKEEIRD